jgi:UDP-N-acetylmuramyl tripeptide synthase
MRRLAQTIARSTGRLSRRLGRGGGTTLPGVVLLKMRPRAAAELAVGLADGSVAISATNGKTTTARLVRSATDAAGITTVANTAGSNLLRGVTAALLERERHATLAILEVDEAALPAVVNQVSPHTIVLMNLFRDQLDRFGELETLVTTWAAMIAGLDPATMLVLNADDPAIAYLGF